MSNASQIKLDGIVYDVVKTDDPKARAKAAKAADKAAKAELAEAAEARRKESKCWAGPDTGGKYLVEQPDGSWK